MKFPLFGVTYEIVTEDSAAEGEAEERGWICKEERLRDAVKAVRSTRTNLVDGIESVETDSWPLHSRVRWITVTNGMEFDTGANESRSLHIPDSITKASSHRIARLLGVRAWVRS